MNTIDVNSIEQLNEELIRLFTKWESESGLLVKGIDLFRSGPSDRRGNALNRVVVSATANSGGYHEELKAYCKQKYP